MTAKFEFVKEMKDTICFSEMSDEPAIGALYIKKEALKQIDYKHNDFIVVEIKKEARK